VKTNLVPKKLSTNVLHVTSNCTIPPLSEAIIPVSNKRFPNGQFLLQPLPFLPRHHVTLAHAIVSLDNHKTYCRLLNPTNAPALLTKNTALATICSISDDSVFSYDKKQTETKSPSVDHDF